MRNDQSQKLPLQSSLNRIAVRRAAEAIAQLGAALPCRVTAVSGSIVTVSFEVNAAPYALPSVTIPKAESRWLRAPTQVGDFGLTMPADAAIAAIAGLAAGTPTLARPLNLTALAFVPIASKAFPAVNTNAAYISGPEGAVIESEGGASVFTLTPTSMTFSVAGHTLEISAAGIALDGKIFATHAHTDVEPGSGDTGPVA